jgi:hypothetical protein
MAQADSQSRTPHVSLGSRETPLPADALILPRGVPAPAAEVDSAPEATDPIFAAIEVHQRELSKYPPAKPGALLREPLKAAGRGR